MWNLMIVDDEPRIRNGLRNVLPWTELGINVAAEAGNGLEALELARTVHPQLVFVDINMPFMNGLELIERLQSGIPKCLIIVISGHDEFSYAQKAVRLNVFDYLLKPIQFEELSAVVDKAVKHLHQEQMVQKYQNWMSRKLEDSSALLRESFLRRWILGEYTDQQVEEELQIFQLQFQTPIGLLLTRPIGRMTLNAPSKKWDPSVLEFAIKNILDDILRGFPLHFVLSMDKGMVVAIVQVMDTNHWVDLPAVLEDTIQSNLGAGVLSCAAISARTKDVPNAFQTLLSDSKRANELAPIVLTAKKYLEANYHKFDLSLSEVAVRLKVDANYLSKLLKKELGNSFVNCLTEIRIQKAIELLNDPTSKIYEIAERVGYNTQHYFSHTFKKVTGVSPLDYRKRGELP